MKYSGEVMECMAHHPKRWFPMNELVNYVQSRVPGSSRQATRVGILRVLKTLHECGSISIREPMCKRGSGALYKWRSEK